MKLPSVVSGMKYAVKQEFPLCVHFMSYYTQNMFLSFPLFSLPSFLSAVSLFLSLYLLLLFFLLSSLSFSCSIFFL